MQVEERHWVNRTVEFLLLMVLVIGFIVWFAWPSIWTASENERLVSVFSSDEAVHLRLVKDAIESRSLNLHFEHYGHLYFNIALVPLLLSSYFWYISEQQIMVLLRFVPAIFGIATIGLTFLLTRRYFGSLCAWLASILLAVVPLLFLKFSAISHPDIPQVFFLVAGIYFCCRLGEDGRWKWMILASACAGLAFATKYAGIFMLPVIWMVISLRIIMGEGKESETNALQFSKVTRYVTAIIGVLCVTAGIIVTPDLVADYVPPEGIVYMPLLTQLLNNMRIAAIIIGSGLTLLAVPKFIWAKLARMPRLADHLKNILKQVILSFATFAGAFFLTSPYSLAGLQFIKGIAYQSIHTAFGHGFKEESGGLTWLGILSSPELLDKFILGLAGVSLVFVLYDIATRGWRQLLAPRSVMWVWVILFMGYFILRVHILWGYYILPVIPFMVILSAQAVVQVARFVATKLPGRMSALLVAAIVLTVIGAEIPKSLHHILEYRQEISNRENNSPAIEKGQWLSEHFPPSTRILYDHYSYVPPSFYDASFTWGGTLDLLQRLQPDVVIVNMKISDRYSDIGTAGMDIMGDANYRSKHEYYKALADGTVGYAVVRDFGDVQIYVKTNAVPACIRASDTGDEQE